VAGSCEHGNEHSDFKEGRQFVDWLSEGQVNFAFIFGIRIG